ncbi:MAG: diadenylate cyclase [Desulfobulbus oligotrophicus]|uniref:Diadenylate cyclase n=2 Tax=Desulfobulbus oligotrophicus TaxID=1909699 RepID=A0A7T5VFQ1_9BACT|nr:diadenylate cyclase [Desulfobulbus oligotrophicus]QQG66901.1 DNA integrity scanning protein DisA nucleotide-binding domain protein [Desulfobulbus oligotrophicus]
MGPAESLTYELLTWRSGLDILLISFGLFFLYRTLLRLGTWKILAGILLALMVFILANAMNLKGIEWIYHNVSNVAVLGLIIIFQPELRKILEKAVSVSPGRLKDQGTDLYEMTGEALVKLAQKHCGAILVFPGREPIRDKISGGYDLNATPSIPLIFSIFDTNSPGHDGAVIIKNGKLTQFGVRLPMSQSTRLSNELGTRHHAAMGLAEQTDSLVMVVSEERGKVSLFVNGEMRPMRTANEITEALIQYQRGKGFLERNSVFKIRKRTIFQAVVSLVIAVIFWSSLTVAKREIVERVLPVSIDYTTPPEDLALVGEKPNEVKVYLSGPKSDIDNLANNPPSIKIDLSKMIKGVQTIIITSENLRLPKGVTLLDTSPQQLKLSLAAVVEKNLPIAPQIIGKLPGTLKIKKITVTPNSVLVAVPVSKEEKIPTEILTTPIYLESISTDSKLFCKIIARPSIQPVSKRWPDVEVFIEVK